MLAAPIYLAPPDLCHIDNTIHTAISMIYYVDLLEDNWVQASIPTHLGGLSISVKVLPQPVTRFEAVCNTTRDPFTSRGSAHVDALVEFITHCACTDHRHLAATAMSDVPGSSLGKQLSSMEDNSDHGRHVRKDSLHGKRLQEQLYLTGSY
ncbi:hypothetical protein E2C01_060256 [Portunus trituberculatus]|uniref:Uncharacterized protein n=1 Tax=Portunus trituberculatus TaxID=210409 RepID=A0A5B7H4R1_PORTR|nr:hypothetical protein [Portunus trituberculatus]